MQGKGGASRGQEEAAAQQQREQDNQVANNRQIGGEASADKRWQSIKRMTGSSCAIRGVTTTSRQMRGKRGGGASRQQGSSV